MFVLSTGGWRSKEKLFFNFLIFVSPLNNWYFIQPQQDYERLEKSFIPTNTADQLGSHNSYYYRQSIKLLESINFVLTSNNIGLNFTNYYYEKIKLYCNIQS